MSPSSRSPYAGLEHRLAGPARNPLGRMGRASRRVVVVLAAACGAAALVLPWVLDGSAQLLGAAPFFAMLVLNALLAVASRLGAELPADLVDERVRHRREYASWVALRILQVPLLAAAVVVGVAVGENGWTITAAQAYAFLYGVFVILAAPTWVLAWNEPDAPPAEDPVLEQPRPVDAPFPWRRLLLSGTGFGVFTVVLHVVGFGGEPPSSLPAALVTGLAAGVLFAALMALYFAWLRRRI